MSMLNEIFDIKIREVKYVEWEEKNVEVSARPFHALAFRIKGDADFTFSNLKCSVLKGEILFLPAGYSYNASYKNKTEMLVIHFDSSFKFKPEVFHVGNTGIIHSMFLRIKEIWDNKQKGYYFSALACMGEILENISINNSENKGETPVAFCKALEYLELNYTSCDLTVEKLVGMAYMSNTYFRKLFLKKIGITPIDYIIKKRLSFAEKLLAKGENTVEEIAFMSGFKDPKYFSRMIKKEYGAPPSKLYTMKKS